MGGLGLLVPPAQAAPEMAHVQGEAGQPVYPQCVSDNNYEYTTAAGAGGAEGTTMFFPGEGCIAQYDLTAQGISRNAHVRVKHLRFLVTGHVDPAGSICGYFEFQGRVSGRSPEGCTRQNYPLDPPTWASVEVSGTYPADQNNPIVVVTWHPTTKGIDNAYLDFLDLEIQNNLLPVPACVTGWSPYCTIQAPSCSPEEDCVSPPPLEPVALCNMVLKGHCTPPCVSGSAEECILPYYCVAGPRDQNPPCWVIIEPGCNEGCNVVVLVLEVANEMGCTAMSPAGVVGIAVDRVGNLVVPGFAGTKAYCIYYGFGL